MANRRTLRPFDGLRRDLRTAQDSAQATILLVEDDVGTAVPVIFGLQDG